MQDRAYAFIDGKAFEETIGEILTDFMTSIDEINWQALTRNASRIFYFDALPVEWQVKSKDTEKPEDKEKTQNKENFVKKLNAQLEKFSRLRRVPNLHVREGVTQSRKNSGAAPLQQKGVDIALVVEVLTHAHLGNMDVARIFASDRDFFPLLDALTNSKVKSELYYDPYKTKRQLIESADVAIELNHYSVFSALPQDKQSFYGITGHTEDIENYIPIETGINNFGAVEILKAASYDNFVMRGKVDSSNTLNHMSRSKPLLISHFEACSKHPVKWANK
jgi:uncharacterized LabA/DUF88 family protein